MRNSENTRWRCLGRCSNTWRRLPVDAGTLSLLTTNCRNIILYDCVCLYPSPPEEYRAFNKSSHFISFFGHFGWVSLWLEPSSCLLLWLVLQVSFEQPLFFYYLVSMRRLFLRAWCYPFSMHVQIISTIFTWWQCLSFPFRSFILPPHLLPSVASKSLIFSSGFYAWMCTPCSHHFCPSHRDSLQGYFCPPFLYIIYFLPFILPLPVDAGTCITVT